MELVNLTPDEKIILDRYKNEQFLNELKRIHEDHSITQSCDGCMVSYSDVKKGGL